jgi:thiol:disulfide interchange protein DsbD
LLVAATKMLAFGVGVGLPLLLIALFGLRLPRSGRWMGYVQGALGVLILYTAFIYFDKGLAGYGVTPERIQHLFLGGLVLMLAVYRWDADKLTPHHRSERALLALMGVEEESFG